jgi:hypothetical protein
MQHTIPSASELTSGLAPDPQRLYFGDIMKKKPSGFVAICQCGEKIGSMDYNRTDRIEAGKILGGWLADGCTIEPRFESSWTEIITQCKCQV